MRNLRRRRRRRRLLGFLGERAVRSVEGWRGKQSSGGQARKQGKPPWGEISSQESLSLAQNQPITPAHSVLAQVFWVGRQEEKSFEQAVMKLKAIKATTCDLLFLIWSGKKMQWSKRRRCGENQHWTRNHRWRWSRELPFLSCFIGIPSSTLWYDYDDMTMIC